MRRLLQLALVGLNFSMAFAEEIKSSDGKTIQAEVVDISPAGVNIIKDGNRFLVPWEKLDEKQAQAFRVMRWLKLEEDRFEGTMSVDTKDCEFTEDADIKLKAYVKLKPMRNVDPLRYTFFFIRVGSEWEWLKYHELKMLIDGEKADVPNTKLYSDVLKSGGTFENVTLQVSDELMFRICKASKVEVRIGSRELLFNEEQMNTLRALRDFFEWSKAKAVSNTAKGALNKLEP